VIVIPQEWTGCRTREDRESEMTIIVGVVGIDQEVGLSVDRISLVSSDAHGTVTSCYSLFPGG
jgi:hypothetical protein